MKPSPVVLLSVCLFGSLASAQIQEPDQNNADFVPVPALVHQVDGKYPDVHLVLFRVGCGKDSAGVWKNKLPDGTYSIEVSGSNSQVSGIQHDDCTVSFDLKFTSADHRLVTFKVLADSKSLGYAFFQCADPMAGPTPGVPEVDVLWAPIGSDVCKRAFGRSVAQNFWCIAVKIGNNSGYQLQIAGLGFRTPFGTPTKSFTVNTPNSSYALTRAVAQAGYVDSPRSYFEHGIEATGLLMTSLTPYFHNPTHMAHYSTAAAIVTGPLQAAFNLVWEDPSIRQANNLDDQSLRDGKLIPNNTQITTVVFLDKRSVTLDFKRACDGLFGSFDADEKFPTLGTLDVKSTIGAKDKGASDLYASCVSGKTSSGLKEALGQLVLVGDKIEYLQRIVVDQTVHSQELASQAQIASVQVVYKTLSVVGKNLDSLPESLVVRAGGVTQTAQRDKSSTPTAAKYSLPKPFASGTAFNVQPVGTVLPVSPGGNVQNPNPTITGAPTLLGKALTLTGEYLDLLPDSLSVTVDSSTLTAKRDSASTDKNATYNFSADQPKGKAFEIKPQQGSVTVDGTTRGTVTAAAAAGG